MTLLVNLFGGPGTGKSTHAARLFSDLKLAQYNAELVHEFAKDLTWEDRKKALNHAPYVHAKQLFRVDKLMGQVEVIVTDSPTLLSIVYKKSGCTPAFEKYVVDNFKSYNAFNVFLCRSSSYHPYNPKGRNQTLEEALEVDDAIYNILRKYEINFHTLQVNKATCDALYRRTEEILRLRRLTSS